MPSESGIPRPPLWYKDAVIYEVHVRAFADSNDDGIGDFVGLTSRLDYLSRLGVDTIWLLPFYPSPLRDDGYDIAEYYDVHPSYGTIEDFKAFLDAAHARDMRVVTELVINHTSDQHPWFQRARRADEGSPERDFYVWNESPDRYPDVRIIFQDTETSNWAWDPVAQSYYWHRFFSHQPDLNYDNPEVKEAIIDVLRFWLDMGVDGLRLDAVPYLFERDGTNGENLPETHAELRRLRAFVDDHYENRMLLAEANQWPEDAVEYFGDGDECHMAFHFPLMPRLYLALQRENRLPIIDILEQTPPIPDDSQWAIFLRNHDELTLEMVSEEERDFMWRVYSPDRRARLNLGIRRRLAPLLENDRRRIELLFALLLSLPGTPVLYYGDEIGMGDNIFLADRDGVRTPMQWSNDRNAGFSRANPQSLYLPVVVDPQFHYETVNVDAQQANPNSLLWWVRDMIQRRQRHPVFGRGDIEFLAPENEHILAYLREGEGETILVVVNLSRHSQFVELDLERFDGRSMSEMLGRSQFPRIATTPYPLSLGPYGVYWFTIDGTPTDVGTSGVVEITGSLDAALASGGPLPDAVARFVTRQPWFGGNVRGRPRGSVRDVIPMTVSEEPASMWIALVSVGQRPDRDDLYVVPLATAFGDQGDSVPEESVIARIHREGEDGVLFDGVAAEAFRNLLLAGVIASETVLGRSGSLIFSASPDLAEESLVGGASSALTNDRGETYLTYDGGPVIKLFRGVEPGINPDLELRRFLTDRTSFGGLTNTAGSIEYRSGDTWTLGVVQPPLDASDTAWNRFGDLCVRWMTEVGSTEAPDEPAGGDWASCDPIVDRLPEPDLVVEAQALASRLGRVTADLHLALGSFSEDPDIRPEAFSLHYQQSLYQSLRAGVRREVGSIRRMADAGVGPMGEALREVAAAEGRILTWLDPIRRSMIRGSRIRLHGDFRLDEVYLIDDEFVIEDFSGDHTRPISERRLRGSPLSDVAQMVRSLDYVAMTTLLERPEADPTWAGWWSRAVSCAFVQSYLEAMVDSPLIPDDIGAIDALLNAYAMSRALRELQWETMVRPEWSAVPLAGVRRMLGFRPSLIS
jgi:maltose alpha-D-glucosyltransferase/alpha-amylase